jgi:hypothetical protein
MKKIILIIGMILIIGGVFASESAFTALYSRVVPGKINVYSPVNGNVYDSRMVPINLTMSEKVRFQYAKYSDNGDPLVTLCRDCDEYGFSKLKKKPFDDGFHSMRIVIMFKNGEVEENVDFIVDTLEPKIRKTSPNRFSNGNFEMEFQEVNPEIILLGYGNDLVGYRYQEINSEDCEDSSRNRDLCKIWVNLTDYNNQEIYYWFSVTDILGRKDQSREKRVIADAKKPVVEDFNYTTDRRRVEFKFEIDEDNFDEIKYIDYNDIFPREKRLCSRLKDGKCDISKHFKSGEHNLTISISDKAGNSVEIKNVMLEV